MSTVKAEMGGLNNLLRNIDILKDTTVTAQAAGMAKVCIDVADYAKANHPFQNRTQNLENSIQPDPVEIEDGVIVGPVRAGMDYAAYVEFGTAKNAPYPYLNPAKEANKQNLVDTLKAVQERAQQALKVES
ncbi:HK97 gp10 family phage protein [Sporomusaceae bacterium BoRhaA]|uniref:HK97-gp10 family putative phage morphogenesis protein n=1 Tax=Pelorhabdus rhamnosifermentans TaxID=2772457 RepID=UPI001FEC01A9|nr:HK97-gp10 family putative phage morphogenesis protein [Pelorhabdus rhamnosifermentans]MBU2703685.1 HK97 gp10 family phage protein [Pelorhabdus rhamnosifermentans]